MHLFNISTAKKEKDLEDFFDQSDGRGISPDARPVKDSEMNLDSSQLL